MTSTELLGLMRLVSPALPIGAFAYSQGLETAIDDGHLKNRHEAEQWLSEIFDRNIAQTDLPLLERLYQSFALGDLKQASLWNQFVFANRETFELLKEERDIGTALGRLLGDIGQPNPLAHQQPGYLCQFAWAGICWNISLPVLKTGFAYAWLENQLAAATKLIPLGQTDAQRALATLSDRVPNAIQLKIADADIGQSLPGFAAMSCRHEHQAARLFRS
ncbi:MAG: urease accessory protein [Candidatus Azotimanducaceae bacterium]|jgi:urease accessory protein